MLGFLVIGSLRLNINHIVAVRIGDHLIVIETSDNDAMKIERQDESELNQDGKVYEAFAWLFADVDSMRRFLPMIYGMGAVDLLQMKRDWDEFQRAETDHDFDSEDEMVRKFRGRQQKED